MCQHIRYKSHYIHVVMIPVRLGGVYIAIIKADYGGVYIAIIKVDYGRVNIAIIPVEYGGIYILHNNGQVSRRLYIHYTIRIWRCLNSKCTSLLWRS
jgi:hypothetical protein